MTKQLAPTQAVEHGQDKSLLGGGLVGPRHRRQGLSKSAKGSRSCGGVNHPQWLIDRNRSANRKQRSRNGKLPPAN